LRPEHRGNVVTIGSFDGVHLGHQAIIQQLLAQSRRLGLPSMVVVFEPQPHEYFSGEKAPARLMRLSEKVAALFAEGVERVCCLQFNRQLRSLSAAEFISRVLVNGLGVKYLVIGDDFRFGCDRRGDYRLLQQAGDTNGFTVTDTRTYTVSEQRVSSTRIRDLLQQGNLSLAKTLLGRPYTISGKVIRGQQLGRQLGTPTANVHLHRYRSPLAGVFAVVTRLPSGEQVNGVANVGVRPTVGGDTKPLLEVHLFDRNDDLYGQLIEVDFKYKLRDEKRFDGLDKLKAQIQQDILAARQFFTDSVTVGDNNV